MAFQEDFKDENKPVGQPVSSPSYVGAGVPGSGAGTSNPTSAAPQRGGSGFVNLIDYVKANEGQGGRMAGDVVNPIVKDMVSANVDQNKLQARSQGIVFNNDPRYKELLEGVSGQDNAIKGIAQNVNALKEPSSLEPALKSIYGNDRRYTQGQNTLDAFITRAGGGQGIINSTVSGFDKLNLAKRNSDLMEYLKGLTDPPKPVEAPVVTSAPPKAAIEQYIDPVPANISGTLPWDVTQKPLNTGVTQDTKVPAKTILGAPNNASIEKAPGKLIVGTAAQENAKGPVNFSDAQKAKQSVKLAPKSKDNPSFGWASLGL